MPEHLVQLEIPQGIQDTCIGLSDVNRISTFWSSRDWECKNEPFDTLSYLKLIVTGSFNPESLQKC